MTLRGWGDTALRIQGSSVIALSPAYPSKQSSLMVTVVFSAWTASGNKEVWEVLPASCVLIGALNSLVRLHENARLSSIPNVSVTVLSAPF